MILTGGLVALSCVFASSLSATQPDLAKADWSVKAPHNLAHNPPPSDQVWKFMNDAWGAVFAVDEAGNLCSFRFVDLRHSGQLSLVAVYNASIRFPTCDEVNIFDKGATGVEFYRNSGISERTDVGHVIDDINVDGHFELVLADGLTFKEGNPPACEVFWPRVYSWTGRGYTEVSSQYPKYYQRELASVKEKIAAIEVAEAAAQLVSSAVPTHLQAPGMVVVQQSATFDVGAAMNPPRTGPEQSAVAAPAQRSATTPDPDDLDCLKAEAAKMERFLGISKDAGMLEAIRWANSDDRVQREFAARIFGDIRTPEALEYEQTLSRDSEPDVASTAKYQLKHWKEPVQPPTFERP